MPISFDEWKKSQDKRSSVGSAITGAVGGKPGGQSGGGSVSGSIVGAVQQQPTGQSGQSGGTMSFTEWQQQQQEQSSGGSSGTVGGSILGGLGVQGGSQQQAAQGSLDAGQKLYEQRKQAQANADPWTPTLKWLGGIAQQAEQARNGLQVDPTETYSAWEDVQDAWEASRKANRAADYEGRDKLIKEYNAARHEMGAQRHTPEPEVQRRYEQARDRLYEQERIHGNIGLNANGELQTMSYSAGERVGNVIGGVIGRTIGHVGSAATWLGEAAARSEYAKSAAHQRELAAFYAMTGNDNASEEAYRMADTLTQRAAQRENLAEFGGAYSFFDKQGRAGNRLVQAAKENQRPVVQMGVDVGSTALEMGFDAVSGSPLVSMGVRVFGGSSQEAREAGAGFLQQGAYGAASASIEVMTEMIGGLKLYGGGQLDEVLEPALREIAGTPGGYALLRAMYTMVQEGNEEVLSDLLQPLAQSIYNGQSVGENYSQLELQDILYDWLLGAASAFGGAVVESGGYAQDYTAMREMQQDLSAQGVETGRMTDEQLRQAYTLDKAGVNVAGLQSAENRAVGGETIGEAYDNMTQEQREAALANMLRANEQRSGQTQTPTDNITRETAQEILRESLGDREAENAERILDLGSESNLREQAIAYHTIATEYGQAEGRSVEDALRSNVRGALNDTQVQHAYAYGESLRKSGQTVGVNGQTTEQGAKTAKPVRRAGLVTAGTFADGSTTYKAADLSKADARDLRILNDIAKAQGVDFVLYESELGEADAEGRRSFIGANGAYRNGVVYLDINAGLTGERTENGKTYTIGQRALLVTAAHELTHHLEHSNPAMYRQLRSFVTERLGGSDSFISYVREAMAREDIGVEAASREVVARACEEVLLDENAIREMQGKKPTLWEQIKEWVREFVKKFESPSGEAVEMRQYANELRRLWLDTATETPTDLRGDIVPSNAPAVDPANAPEASGLRNPTVTGNAESTQTSTQAAEAEQQTGTDTTQHSVRNFTSVEAIDAEIDRLQSKIAETYDQEEEVRNTPEYREAYKRAYMADSYKEKVEGRRALKAVKEKLNFGRFAETRNELAEQIKQLREQRKAVMTVSLITDADYRKLKKTFGTTTDFDVAGFILKDGSALDFSGKKRYGKQHAGGREILHNEIGDVIGMPKDTSPRINMLNNGNIRLAPEVSGINLAQMPTAAQIATLREFIDHNDGAVVVEIDDIGGDTVETFSYYRGTSSSKVISDIRSYFNTGATPTPASDLRAFYSQREADAMTDREILMLAAEEYGGEEQIELAEFRDAMEQYQNYDEAAQEHLQKLSELQTERKAVTDMRTSMGEITPQEKQKRLDALDKQIASERGKVSGAEKNAADALSRVTQLEKGRALQDILVKERAAQRQRTRAQVNERTRRRDTRRKVEKLAKELQARVAKPSEKRYIPADLMRQTVDVLQAINLDSSRPGTKSGEALRARLLEMQERYRTLETDETYKGASYDPTVAEMLQNMVKTVGDTPINKMTATQLESVYNTLRAMTHVIQTGIKDKIAGEDRYTWEWSHDMTRETRSVNKPKDSLISGWVNTQLSAQRMFRRLGNYTKNSAWEKVYRMLNDGQLKMTLIQMEGAQIFADLIGKENEKAYRELNSYKDKDLVDVGLTDVDGNSIKISHGMMVSLYMHLLNEQNARHVARGGLTIPDLKGYYTGADDRGFGSGERRAVGISAELAEARREQADAEDELREAKQSGDAEAIQQAEDAVDAAKANVDKILAKGDAYLESLRKSIESQLSDYERKWIEATQELMDGYSKDRLNETTLDVYGIKKARVEHYFPIKSDRNFTRGDFEAVSRNMSLENVGFMKERVEGTNPMYLMDVADVVNTQISNVAQYCGLMPAIRSFNKIWNKSEAGNTVSLKDTVNQKFGQGGLKYVENLIADLQGARRGKSDSLSRFLSGMRGNMAGANLTISLNTALAQAASYPTAAAEIGWTPLIKAFFKGGQSGRMISRADRELIAKYTPLLWTRLQGYSTVELGDLAGNNQLAGRVFRKMRFITGWIQAMDTATVGRLWYAAQYYVDAKNPELQKGSDEYYKETAKVFNDIVEKTQPDYTTMQRPDILRNPNELVRSLTMFMTQRLQNFNLVYDAVATAQKYRQDYRNGQANGVTSEDVKQAQHEARRAVVSQIAAGATIVVFKTLSGILQHALDGYRDDDKELTAESISFACLDMFLDTMASNFLWGGELYDVIESAITGNRYYGLEVNGVQSISDILSTSQSLFSMLRDYKTLSWDKVQPKFITLAKKLGPMLGLPIGNAVKLFKGIWLWGQEFIHAAEDGDLLKAFDFEEGVERGAGIEANRYVSAWLDGDRAKMREIIGGLGVSMTSFNSQLSSEIGDRYKDGSVNAAQAIRMLQELRGMTPEEAAKTVNEWKFKVDTGIEYDKIKEQLLNGSISVQRAAAYWQKYGGMSAEDATLKANYVAACGAAPGLADKLSQAQYKGWYNNVRSAGVKVDVYAEIRSTASTDGNSNVSQAEAAAAITRAINARQLTPAQAQAVWQSFSGSWKTTYAEYIAQNK